MTRCPSCNSKIFLGGVRDGELRFCNRQCYENWHIISLSNLVPEEVVLENTAAIHQGPCPVCGGPGPVDVYIAYFIWSALFFTSWSGKQKVCCRGCGLKSQIGYTAASGVVGWWGFPWGVLLTPVLILRNLVAICMPPNSLRPSDKLIQTTRMSIALALSEQEPEAGGNTEG